MLSLLVFNVRGCWLGYLSPHFAQDSPGFLLGCPVHLGQSYVLCYNTLLHSKKCPYLENKLYGHFITGLKESW